MARITERDLDEQLKDLNDWERFGLNLPGMSMNDIERIRIERRHDFIPLKKLSLYEEWLKRCSRPTWENVIEALEKIGEKTLANKVRVSTASTISDSNQQAGLMESANVSKHIIEELNEMHQEFVEVTEDVKKIVETAVDNGSMSIKRIVSRTMEERAYTVPERLFSVQNSYEYFQVIQPLYSFLNCYLIIRLAVFLLAESCIANRAQEYEKKVERFKEMTEVTLLRDNLERYLPNFYPEKVQVIVQLEKTWGRHKMWLVEELMKEMFDLRSRDQCMWFRVKPGSEVLTFLLPKNLLMLLIVNCAKKIEFMELMGVIRLQIGCVVVLERKEDLIFCFENSLIYAAETMNFEVAEFLLRFLEIDVNKSRTVLHITKKLEVEIDYSVLERLKDHQAWFNMLWENVDKKIHAAVQTNPDMLGNLKAIVIEERPSYSLILNQVKSVDHFISTMKPFHNFLNYSLIMKIAGCLGIIHYIEDATETFKTMTSIAHLNSSILPFFQPSQPEGSVNISIGFANVWQKSSIVMVEKLVQKIFELKHPDECPWFRVIIGSVLAVFIAPKHMKKNLIDTSKKKVEFMKLIGIINLKIGDKYVIKEANNDDYTFKVGMEEAKSLDNKETLKFLTEVEADIAVTTTQVKIVSDVNANAEFESDGESTALMIACGNADSKLVKLLLEKSADSNIETKGKATALIYAALGGSGRIVKMLLNHNADNTSRETALLIASQCGCINVVKMLLAGKSNVDTRDKNGVTPLLAASLNGHLCIVQMLLEAKADITIANKHGQTPLLVAVDYRHLDIVKRLLKAKADPNIKSGQGGICLISASFYGNLEMVNCLLEAKANPNIQQIRSRCSPLHVACMSGNLPICKALIRAKANPNIRDCDGNTPLHTASENGHASIVKCLIAAEANVDVQQIDGETPLFIACVRQQLEIVHILLKAEADPNILVEGRGALHIASMTHNIPLLELLFTVRCGANPNIQDPSGLTALHNASAFGNLTMVKLLLKAGAYTHLSAVGRTPLHLACVNGHIEIVKELIKDHNTDPDIAPIKGETPLLHACLAGNVETAAVLLKAKANPNIRSRRGTPLQIAMMKGNTPLIKLLREHGATT